MLSQNDPKVRTLTFDRAAIDVKARTVPISVSSNTGDILRYVTGKGIGYEVLAHDSLANIDLTRFAGDNGGPLLWSHDREQIIGRFVPTSVADGKLRGVARFGNSTKADEVFRDIQDGIITDTSCCYEYDEADVIASAVEGDYPTYVIKRWALIEASMVAVPADTATGVGRAEVTITVEVEDSEAADQAEDAAEGCCPECGASCSSAFCPDCGAEMPVGAADPGCPNPDCTPENPCPECRACNTDRSKTAVAAPTENLGRSTTALTTEASMPEITGAETQAQNTTLEVLQLRSIAHNLGKGKEAEEILAAKPLNEARALINTLLATASAPVSPSMDMSKKEADSYSYARAIQNALARMEGEKVARSFEDEVAEQLEKNIPSTYSRKGGIMVPLQLRTTLTSAGSTTGAEAVFTQYGGELIELLRNYAAVIQMGARVLTGLNGPIHFPKQTADATAAWVAENPGADASATNPTFSTVALSPKILLGATAFSRSLMAQSVFSIEGVVRQSLAQAHALAFDKAAIHGLGSSNQPTGVYLTTGTNTVAFGGVPTYGLLQDMVTEVAKDNALAGNMGFITTPGIAGKLAQTLESSVAGAKYIWQGDRQNGTVCGYKAASTNQVSSVMSTLQPTGSTQHGIVFGNWQDLILAMWGSMELVLDPYSLKKQGLIEVASHQLADIAPRHAQSFCVSTGATLV